MSANMEKLLRETKIAKAAAASEILLDLRNRAEHERRMIECYARDLEAEYLTDDEKMKIAKALLERQEKLEMFDAMCEFVIEREKLIQGDPKPESPVKDR